MPQNPVLDFQVITGSYSSHYSVSLVGIEPAIAKNPHLAYLNNDSAIYVS